MFKHSLRLRDSSLIGLLIIWALGVFCQGLLIRKGLPRQQCSFPHVLYRILDTLLCGLCAQCRVARSVFWLCGLLLFRSARLSCAAFYSQSDHFVVHRVGYKGKKNNRVTVKHNVVQ